ncbi:MAG: hypothetical protein K2Q18_11910 [Bdellovibrionales bacterium]|nr:hypothetical protein [Bdellovibrionales bacterium]
MKTIFALTILITATNSFAYDNNCRTQSQGASQSVCQGRVIPASQARNISRQELKCSQNTSHYIRKPQKFNFNEWSQYVNSGDRQGAQDLRTALPAIEWGGTIPYNTVETWNWQSCDLVTDASACGTETKEETCTKYREKKNSDGTTSQESYQSTCEVQVAKTCYTDITHNEAWVCSNEVITYTAKFLKPSKQAWNPNTPGYIDAIPNKYDLLPGELEDVQVLSNNSLSTTLSPQLIVGGAWNKYTYSAKGSAVNVQCRQNNPTEMNIDVKTESRITGKASPNAFKLPVDGEGKAISPLIIDAEGKPKQLRLHDTSAATISMIAEQSRKNNNEPKKVSVSANPDGVDLKDLQKNPSFFKNTKIKMVLLKKNSFFADTQNTKSAYGEDGDFVEQSSNVFSLDEDIALSDFWNIPLYGKANGKDISIYTRKHRSEDRALKPGQEYSINISMYQKGAKGLYLQDCDEDKEAWQCKWYALFLKRSEKDYFSEPIVIDFKTPGKEAVADKRDFVDKFWDFVK